MKLCNQCGKENDDRAKSCYSCGCNNFKEIPKEPDPPKEEYYYQDTSGFDKFKNFISIVFIIVIAFVFLRFSDGESEEEYDFENSDSIEISSEQDIEADTNIWRTVYKTSDIIFTTKELLCENISYYEGKTVAIYGILGTNVSDEYAIEKDKGFTFAAILSFGQDVSGIDEGDEVCVVGIVQSGNEVTETVNLSNCYLLPSIYKDKCLKGYKEELSKINGKNTEDAKNTKKSYIKSCKKYDYKSIMRKPKDYKGKKIKVKGKIYQIEDGYFDSTTFTIYDSDDNLWMINYSYSKNEERLLEDDFVEIYGESTGTTQYTTILGNKNKVCSIDAEYIKRK